MTTEEMQIIQTTNLVLDIQACQNAATSYGVLSAASMVAMCVFGQPLLLIAVVLFALTAGANKRRSNELRTLL